MFKLKFESGEARYGELKTSHGKIETPFFMPVATKLAVKLINSKDLERLGLKAIISNAFILYLDPGVKLIEKAGGVHKFMSYNHVIFTDSGGFQMVSDKFLVEINRKWVKFRSPFDKSLHIITPEKDIEIQNKLNSDVAMCLDYMPRSDDKYEDVKESVEITYEWAKRCKLAHKNKKQLLFGIIQGGCYKDLRKRSSELITSIGFDGYAIGGLGIGESREKMMKAVEMAIGYMPKNKPRYLMGIGTPQDLIRAIGMGVDVFDSCYVTKHSRHEMVFTQEGEIQIGKREYKEDFSPLDKDCKCEVCENYTKSYIYHLLKINELSWKRLVTWHNLHFVNNLMKECRKAIKEDRFQRFERDFVKNYLF
ncbi:MAG TPA: tRNA guanosine(34) transglycosylase Tgt [Candidatus Nanoarchaeia archaeon]|nr:tRNA guanosine(34) transglycosylase Tgt [Candidatus Nanoarchaeia archaeon]